MRDNPSTRARADVVVIGGGVIGCSIAYHLCRAGIVDVMVLERNELSTAATARSAGCLSHARSDASTIRMITRTRAAIPELEAALGEPLDFRQVGCIRAVLTEAREIELRRMEACLASEGIEVEVLDAAQARACRPWLRLDGARRIVRVPVDGYVDGARLGVAYARAARSMGAHIERGVTVRNVMRDGERVTGVVTDRGAIHADYVVEAAGAWSVQLAASLGFGFAATPTRSHYWITAPDGAGDPMMPNVQLPDMRAYLRSEVGGMLVGLQEPRSITFDPMSLETDMGAMSLTDEDRDTDLLLDQAAQLRAVVPDVDRWGFAHHIAGLSMYTPDGKFIVGAVPGLLGFFVAGGCCGSGVAASGGFGQVVADLIKGRVPDIDIGIYRPARFGVVDPASQAFRDRCAAARSGKSRGAVDVPVAAIGSA
jgi:4-methylaminobutanoate oxidase (formaldehyde-forming)